MKNNEDVKGESPKSPAWWVRPAKKIAVGTGVAAALWVGFYLVFRGSAAAIANRVGSSAGLKVLVVATLAVVVAAVLNEARPGERPRYNVWRTSTTATVSAGVALTVVVALVAAVVGGYTRGQDLAASLRKVDGGLPAYQWRTPWDVAAQAVSQRASVEVGNFAADQTTYLPALKSYSTPVSGRGVAAGFTQVVVQREGSTKTTGCKFTAPVPRPGGFGGKNLRRAVAFVDPTLVFHGDDVWGFCDGDEARLVVPVTRMVGGLEGHPVPAGVVVFDGKGSELRDDVRSGELPGPVYPMSLAGSQRSALASTGSFMDKVFDRAGYELSEDSYVGGALTANSSDSEAGSVTLNNAELLLGRANGKGYDFVTPLTPRSTSQRIVAVSTVAADHVRAGRLNPVVVHSLGGDSQRGNADQVEAIRATFPDLGWAAGVSVAEIVPTGPGVFEASLRNGGVVSKRVRVTGEEICLLSTAGAEIECTALDSSGNGNGKATAPDGPTTAPSGELSDMSDQQLLDRIDEATAELRRRSKD